MSQGKMLVSGLIIGVFLGGAVAATTIGSASAVEPVGPLPLDFVEVLGLCRGACHDAIETFEYERDAAKCRCVNLGVAKVPRR